jgi:Lrp/AsnC family transcriptional regulator, leucine-responsive regulatory protein
MIDEISLKILKILQDKARIPNVEVARQVGLVPSAVLERIRKLEKLGFIDGYEVRLNPQRFHRTLVGFIHIKTHPAETGNDLVRELSAWDEVQEVHFIAGDDGYLIKVRVSAPQDLDYLVRKRIAGLTGVQSTRSYIAMATFKETARIPIDDLDCGEKTTPTGPMRGEQ